MHKWYLVHTRLKWEKKVVDHLELKGIESYCPVKKVRRKWSDRIKTIEEPLFKAHVFVKILADQKAEVRMTEGVLNFAYLDGKPAQIKDREIQALKKLLCVKKEIQPGKSTRITNLDNLDNPSKTFDGFLHRFNNWVVTYTNKPKLV